jgi:hypothetical protein
MKYLFLAIVFILVSIFSSHAHAESDWTATDTAWQAAVVTTLALDWSQTRTIAKNPYKYTEMNPVLGEHPSVGRVNGYFAAVAVGHTAIAILLPPKAETFGYKWNPRRVWQATTVAVEVGAIANNIVVGIKFDIP